MNFICKLFVKTNNNILKTTAGEIVNLDNISSPFDFDSVYQRQEGGFYYLLDNKNTEIALNNIPIMNDLVKKAHSLCNEVSRKQFNIKQFSKQQIKNRYNEYYTIQMAFNPLTKEKKVMPKFPYTIYYFPNDKLFADVFYNQLGNIGKIKFTIWKNDEYCCTVNVAEVKGELVIKSIYKLDFETKIKIYPE